MQNGVRVVMTMQPRLEPAGLFDVRYAAFLETVVHLRERLHRYCTRMTGSALDGEDVMQETLFEIYRKIETIDDPGALRSWLFRTAHNRCIDFLRNRQTRRRAEANFAVDEIVLPAEPAAQGADRAIERLVIHLPPKERACILLKDVFDAYERDYVRAWDDVLRDITLRPTASANELADVLAVAAGPDSPLKGLLVAVAKNTDLTGAAQPTATDTLAQRALAGRTSQLEKILGSQGSPEERPGAFVSAHFAPIRQLVGGGETRHPTAHHRHPASGAGGVRRWAAGQQGGAGRAGGDQDAPSGDRVGGRGGRGHGPDLVELSMTGQL